VEDPILYIGVDIGIKRDTSAITAIFPNYDDHYFGLWGHRIFSPPVNMFKDVEPCLFNLLENHRVAAVLFDPYQMATTQQKLMEAGFGNKLVEVNQGTEMRMAANTLHSHMTEGSFVMYGDLELRAHFSWCHAEHGERGWHIKKKNQTKPIDGVVSLAMALMGATGEIGHAQHPGFHSEVHAKSILSLP
jgi:phage terminase large subunit-like protein